MNTFNHGDIIASEHNEYKILGNLSKGSFGVTYISENIRTKEECIIKKFQPEKENTWEIGLKQFNREAEKLKKIEHNQIPRFFEYFSKDNEYYLVQEYIKGHDLTKEIKKGFNNEKYVIRLVEDILEVLSFLHSKDLIHRDLKPSNIRRRETDDKIVLIDFGGVKEVDQGPGTNLTSPSYSPLEQHKGKSYKSSDIYAVGIIAIQSLTGQDYKSQIFPKFENQGQNNNLPGLYQPDRIEWHKYAPNVSKELADIIDKMVMRDHKQRYKSAEEALEALRAIKSTGIRTPLNPPIPPIIEEAKASNTIIVGGNKINIVTAVLVSLGIIAASGIFAIIPVTGKYIINLFNGGKVELNKEFSKNNIKIKYPSDWNIIRHSQEMTIDGNLAEFTPEKVSKSCALTQITISMQNLKRVLSLQEYKQFVEKEIKELNPQAIIKDETKPNTLLLQKNAYELSYSKKENQCETQVLEKGTVKNGKGYHINYEGTQEEYEKYLPVAKAMFESFNIEDEK